MTIAAYPCVCCGHRVHDQPPGSLAECPICGWVDDAVQLRFPDVEDGANAVSLWRVHHRRSPAESPDEYDDPDSDEGADAEQRVTADELPDAQEQPDAAEIVDPYDQPDAHELPVADGPWRREPTADEPIDAGWRMLRADDPVEMGFAPVEQGTLAPWPSDFTRLYWWRPTFWGTPAANGISPQVSAHSATAALRAQRALPESLAPAHKPLRTALLWSLIAFGVVGIAVTIGRVIAHEPVGDVGWALVVAGVLGIIGVARLEILEISSRRRIRYLAERQPQSLLVPLKFFLNDRRLAAARHSDLPHRATLVIRADGISLWAGGLVSEPRCTMQFGPADIVAVRTMEANYFWHSVPEIEVMVMRDGTARWLGLHFQLRWPSAKGAVSPAARDRIAAAVADASDLSVRRG